MSMRDLELKPVPVSRGERWLRFMAVISFVGAVAWYWSARPENWSLGAIFFVWLMVMSASLATVRIVAYRRRAGVRERRAEQMAETFAARLRQ